MKSRSFWRDNGLTIVIVGLFLILLAGQTIAGWLDQNNDNRLHHEAPESLVSYTFSSDNAESVFENWESEFLQMGAYVVLTAYLFQRGSSESKDPDAPPADEETPKDDSPAWLKHGGWHQAVYSHSLSLAFGGLFLFSFIGHAIGGAKAYSEELKEYGQPALSTWQYLHSARFWFESLQNWQSEFLAVASIIILSIFLREKGSPESKSLNSPHSKTGD